MSRSWIGREKLRSVQKLKTQEQACFSLLNMQIGDGFVAVTVRVA